MLEKYLDLLFSVFCSYFLELHEMAIILGRGIWVDLSLFLQATVTHSWLQNKLSLIPSEKRTVFLTLTET